jgi:hypothetical protein
MSKRVSVVLPDSLGEALEQMATAERRSHSQMGAILIEEAIASRQGKQFPALVSPKPLPAPTFEPEPHLEPPTPPTPTSQPEAVQSEPQPANTPEVSERRRPRRRRFQTEEEA